MRRNKRLKKGFTLLEIIVVMSIMVVLFMIAVPHISSNFKLTEKVDAVTVHKIVISAIDSWVADNSDPTQKPANINSVNSQGRHVYQYISEKEVLDKLGNIKEKYIQEGGNRYKVDVLELNPDIMIFKDGILVTAPNNDELDTVYGVLPLEKNGSTYKIAEYEELKNRNIILNSPCKYEIVNLKGN